MPVEAAEESYQSLDGGQGGGRATPGWYAPELPRYYNELRGQTRLWPKEWMSAAQRRDLRVGSRLVLFDFAREDLVEINLVLRVLPTLDFEETLVHPTTPSNCSRGF